MKKLLIVVMFLGICCIPLCAQDYPKAEVFGGYGLLHESDLTLHGFDASFEGNINEYLGIVGDFGFTTKSESVYDVDVRLKATTFMGGPRFSFRSDRYRLFVHYLLGGYHLTGSTGVSGLGDIGVGETNFAMDFGGGLDISLNKRISIRPAQVDLLTIRYTDILDMNGWESKLRYSAGIVFKFGAP
jgi:hypothetical protein